MKLIIDDLIDEIRLDSYLSSYLPNISRSKLQTVIKNERIKVNLKPVKPSYIVKPNDIIEIDLSFDDDKAIPPENIPLDVKYEDDNLLVVNKPSGMLTHPTSIETTGTLVNALLYKYGKNLSDINGDNRPGIIHRLDRNTSGLLMIAKNNKAHCYLAEKIKNREIEKNYYAVVKGILKDDHFIINEKIGRSAKHPEKMCVSDDGKESITEVSVIQRFNNATLIDIHLITGRTHQIRVHMSYIGHPVYNDTLYGFGKIKLKTDEQVLQSYKLTFPKPFTDEPITVEIEKDEKLKKTIAYLHAQT